MEGMLLNERYRIDARLGQGGMGMVYQAYDTTLQRVVAVKVLRETGLDSMGKTRLLEEARAAAQLDHPNIVTVYDVGQSDGAPFLVMQWVAGATLYDQPPGSLVEILEITRQLCTALGHAHKQGIVHRDLKPENVIVSPDGTTRLMDFGLARSASRLSGDEGMVGTVAYMAPEQALGHPVDGRADLYALGVLLYELTTGGLPFQADDPFALITQHIYAPVVPPRAKNETIPLALNGLILSLLAKQPAERPASAYQVQEELAAIAKTLDVDAENGVETGLKPSLIPKPPLPPPEIRPSSPGMFLERIVRGQLVDRHEELAALRESWHRVRQGTGQLVLLSGEPGIGKTRLVQELATQVQVQGGRVLTGVSYPEQPATYGAFAYLVRAYLEQYLEYPFPVLPVPVLADLLSLAPGMVHRFSEIPQNPRLEPQDERLRLFGHLVEWCRLLAAQAPLMLVLEDIHWAEEGTLALLLHLSRVTQDQPMLLVATYRETDLGDNPPLQDTLRALVRERLGKRVKLSRLDEKSTEDLLNALFAEAVAPEFLVGIYRETEGVPFFVEEVCKALVESEQVVYTGGHWQWSPELGSANLEDLAIPQSVQIALQRRSAHLASEAQELLTVAAVLGRVFDFELLAAVSGAGEEAIIATLEAAEDAQLVQEQSGMHGGTFEFTHALIPGTLVEGLSGLRRRRWHQKTAGVLADLRPQETALIAQHHWQAENQAGVPYLKQAGDQAAERYANADAVTWYSRALELVPEEDLTTRFDLLFARGRSNALLGRRKAERKDLEQLEALASAVGDPRMRARAALRRLNFTFDPSEALEIIKQAVSWAKEAGDQEMEVSGYQAWGGALSLLGQYNQAEVVLKQALKISQAAGNRRGESRALIGLGSIQNSQGDFSRTAEYYGHAIAIAREIGDRLGEATALAYLGRSPYYLGRYSEAVSYYQQCLAITREIGHRTLEGNVLDILGQVAIIQGDYAKAQTYVEPGLAISIEAGFPLGEAMGLFDRGLVLTGLGQWVDAQAALESALQRFEALKQTPDVFQTRARLAQLFLVQGRVEEALAQVDIVLEYLEAGGNPGLWLNPVRNYLICAKVLQASQGPRFRNVMETAHAYLQERTEKIADEADRRSFLENVPWHREFLELWEASGMEEK